MHKTQAKIQSMSTAEWHQYHQLLESRRLMDYFTDEILRFTHSQLKPDDVLRRFSLNGDGQLDLKEFQLAVKRLGIIHPAAATGYEATQTTNDSDHARATNKKAKELFSVFCPSQNKKLDIDMFCRIMTEWSLTLLKSQQPQSASSSSSSQQLQQLQQQSMASIPTPYAIENNPHFPSSGSDPGSSHNHVVHSEGEMIWRRIRDAVVQHLDKLSQIYFKLDISSSGSVSQDEFELAMSHIGVFLTAREYEKLYEALPTELKYFPPDNANFSVKYADFLAVIQQTHPQANKHILQTSAQTSSPPIATNARLWDLLVQALDKLEPLIQQYERAQQRYVSAETFRDLLLRCGIALSNPDYAAMRVRLLPFTDSTGLLGLSALLHALKAHDRTSMVTSVRNSTTVGASGLPTVSPIRTGRKTVFPSVNEQLRNTSSSSSSSSSSFYQNGSSSTSHTAATHAAGKSNEQRNQEANRAVVKIRDDSRWKSDLHFPTNNGYDHHNHQQQPVVAAMTGTQRNHPSNLEDPDAGATGTLTPLALERRILTKLQQLKDVGQIGSSSPQTVFPGDRFGRITRGTFRQSLVHLGVLARYAEVESLFWTLDPNGRGYIVTQDLYDHLNTTATSTTGNWSLPSLSVSESSGSPTSGSRAGPTLGSGRLPRSVQKIFEGMLLHLPVFLQICQRCDPHRTGLITRGELTAAIQELGVLASPQDVQTAITALTQRVELLGSSSAATATEGSLPPAEPYHPKGIVYSKIEDRLKQLCSDLLSPKKRRQHLSTASVLLAPQETQAFASVSGSLGDSDFNMNIANETDALWNCPRRKQNHDHRAMKSSIQITDRVYDDSPRHATYSQHDATGDGSADASSSSYSMDKHRQLHRGRRLAVISILQDLLERRGELKSVMDLHRHADIHGQVNTRDLVEILMASRLSLSFSNAVPAGITARDFVDVLYPQHHQQNGSEQPFTVSFLDLLHRISDLLSELTRVTPVSGKTVTGLYSNNAYPREVTRRMHTSGGIGGGGGPGGGGGAVGGGVAYSPIQLDPVSPRSRKIGQPGGRTMSLFASDELSLQRKLLYESRLSELLTSEKGRHSAAVLIRHAFKGVMAREMVVPIDNGEFEAVCRASDLKHVCFRLGLDLDAGELHFLVASLDTNQSGYIASPQLMQFFTHLALRATGISSGGVEGGPGGGAERGGGGGGIYAAATTPRDELSNSRISLGY